MAEIAKVIRIIGSSPESFAKAAQSAVDEAAKTVRGITGADVVTMSARGRGRPDHGVPDNGRHRVRRRALGRRLRSGRARRPRERPGESRRNLRDSHGGTAEPFRLLAPREGPVPFGQALGTRWPPSASSLPPKCARVARRSAPKACTARGQARADFSVFWAVGRTRISFTSIRSGCETANMTARATSSASRASETGLSKNGVSTMPGSMSVTRTPVPFSSCRSASPMPVTAHFVDE